MNSVSINRREKKKIKMVNKIISTAVSLFNNKGVSNTTMEEIAETVDISKGTLYNYFSSKEEIISSYIKNSFKENYSDRINKINELENTQKRIEFIYKLLLTGIGKDEDLFEYYLVYRMKKMVSFEQKDEEKSGLYLIGEKIIKEGQKDGEIRKDISSTVIREFFEFIFIQIVKEYFLLKDKKEIDKKIPKYIDLFMKGVKKNAES